MEFDLQLITKRAVPAAVMIPNMTQKIPPMRGSGMVTNRAPNLEKTPKANIMNELDKMTRRLPTCS